MVKWTDCNKYVDRRLGGWDNIHLVYHHPEKIAGWHVIIECADDSMMIVKDRDNRRWLIQYACGCDYDDCSGVDDPHGSLELYRIILKHAPRYGIMRSYEKRFTPRKRGDK